MKQQQSGEGRKATRITGSKHVTIIKDARSELCYPEELKGRDSRGRGCNSTDFMEDQWVRVSSG